MQAVILSLVIPVVRVIISAISPMLRDSLTVFLRDLYAKSLGTSSPWDDFAVGLLCALTGVSTDGVVATVVPGVTPTAMPAAVKSAITTAAFSVKPTVSGGTTPDPMSLPGMQGQ